jgi:hypothetical protein
VLFEFESDSNSNSNLNLISKLFIKVSNTHGSAFPKSLTAGQAPPPSEPTNPLSSLISMTGGASLSYPTFLPLWPSWRRTRAGAPHPGARDGTVAPPGRPAHRADRRALEGSVWGRGQIPFVPLRRAPQRRGVSGGAGRHLARIDCQTGGNQGNSRHPSHRRASKAGVVSKPSLPEPPTPLGFSFPFSSACNHGTRRGGRRPGGRI